VNLLSDTFDRSVEQWERDVGRHLVPSTAPALMELDPTHHVGTSDPREIRNDAILFGQPFDPKLGPHTVASEFTFNDGARRDHVPNERSLDINRATRQMSGLTDTLKMRERHEGCAGCKSKAEKQEVRIEQMQRELDGIRRLLVTAIADVEVLKHRGLPLAY
jgi:hypothetical protein